MTTTSDIASQPVLQVPVAPSTELALTAINALRAEMGIRGAGTEASVEAVQKLLEQMIARTAAELAHTKGRQIEAVHGEINTAIGKLHGEIDTEIAKVRGEFGKYVPHTSNIEPRVSVLERQIIDAKENTALALEASDKSIINARIVAEKAVAKVELAATQTALEASISGLERRFEQQIGFQKQITEQGLAASNQAVEKAEKATEKRFESVNEFRATLADQQRDLATKTECNLRFNAVEERLNQFVADFREDKGRNLGVKEKTTESRMSVGQAISAAAMVLLAISVGLAAITLALRLPH